MVIADADEHSERDGTARLCVQYEMEMSSSKTRHMSLLDALDKTDPTRDEDDALAGEERVRGQKAQHGAKKNRNKQFIILLRHLSHER